jgi:pilus assembly protein Flp/PilA
VANLLRRLRTSNDEGASSVEYGLLVVAIAAVIVLIIFVLGHQVRTLFHDTCHSLSTNGSFTETESCG